MAYETIEVGREGAACVIRLHRPDKKNAFNLQMKHELMDAARKAGDDPEARAVVITGGEQFFSSGQDLNEALAAEKPAFGDSEQEADAVVHAEQDSTDEDGGCVHPEPHGGEEGRVETDGLDPLAASIHSAASLVRRSILQSELLPWPRRLRLSEATRSAAP